MNCYHIDWDTHQAKVQSHYLKKTPGPAGITSPYCPAQPPLVQPPTLPAAHTNGVLGRVNGYMCLGNLLKISAVIESIFVTMGDHFTSELPS